MKVLESSNSRLRLSFADWRLFGTICDFDRQKDEAEITSLLLLVPFRRRRVALSEIADAEVRKRRQGWRRYVPVLRLSRGGTIAIAAHAKEEAIEAMRTIRSFLELNP